MTEKKRPFDPRRDRRGDDAWHHLENEQRKRRTMEGIASVAMEGDREAALKMLKYAEYHIYKAQNIPDVLRDYLADCFGRAVREESTEFAFNLKFPGHGTGKRKWSYFREWRESDFARGVEYHRQQGRTLDEAYQAVADGPQAMEDRLGRAGVAKIKAAYLKYFPKDESG